MRMQYFPLVIFIVLRSSFHIIDNSSPDPTSLLLVVGPSNRMQENYNALSMLPSPFTPRGLPRQYFVTPPGLERPRDYSYLITRFNTYVVCTTLVSYRLASYLSK